MAVIMEVIMVAVILWLFIMRETITTIITIQGVLPIPLPIIITMGIITGITPRHVHLQGLPLRQGLRQVSQKVHHRQPGLQPASQRDLPHQQNHQQPIPGHRQDRDRAEAGEDKRYIELITNLIYFKMKKYILISFLVILSLRAMSQENMVTVSGGYSFANIEDTDLKGTGFRVNGLYEFNPSGGMVAHGFAFGYIGLKASEGVGSQTINYTINSFPIYYAPKVMFGKEKLKFFIKGVLGAQFASLKKEGLLSLSDNDFGFYGGGGGGIMVYLKENIFLNAEYEIAWASNSWYKDGWMNTAGGGIGFKF
jgi:hypothetical protein